nr:MAG TPA: hypothetical protein [Caudoviricetes sp.]
MYLTLYIIIYYFCRIYLTLYYSDFIEKMTKIF